MVIVRWTQSKKKTINFWHWIGFSVPPKLIYLFYYNFFRLEKRSHLRHRLKISQAPTSRVVASSKGTRYSTCLPFRPCVSSTSVEMHVQYRRERVRAHESGLSARIRTEHCSFRPWRKSRCTRGGPPLRLQFPTFCVRAVLFAPDPSCSLAPDEIMQNQIYAVSLFVN